MSYEDSFNQKAGQPSGPKKPHNLAMEGRRKLSLSGVEEVESFDEQEIVMRTSEGGLIISGEGLSVSRLNVESGDVNVQGYVSSLHYEEIAEERRGFWSKLFR